MISVISIKFLNYSRKKKRRLPFTKTTCRWSEQFNERQKHSRHRKIETLKNVKHMQRGICFLQSLPLDNEQNMKYLQFCTGFIFCRFPAIVKLYFGILEVLLSPFVPAQSHKYW